jgi:hypothetical protein
VFTGLQVHQHHFFQEHQEAERRQTTTHSSFGSSLSTTVRALQRALQIAYRKVLDSSKGLWSQHGTRPVQSCNDKLKAYQSHALAVCCGCMLIHSYHAVPCTAA